MKRFFAGLTAVLLAGGLSTLSPLAEQAPKIEEAEAKPQPVATAPKGLKGPPGIFGEDDLEIIDTSAHPYSAIGQVNVAQYASKHICTGTLIAPDKVMTAAHCVRPAKIVDGKPSIDIHFVAGVRRSDFLGHSKTRKVSFIDGFVFPARPSVEAFKSDVALLHLEKPLDIEPIPVSTLDGGPAAPLAHVLYANRRRFLPMIDQSCFLKRSLGDLWVTDCDTHGGGSGGPVFLRSEDEWRLAGVMVGISKHQSSFVVPAHVWRDLAAQ